MEDVDNIRSESCPACAGCGLISVAGGEDFIYCNDDWHLASVSKDTVHLDGCCPDPLCPCHTAHTDG